MIKNLEVVGAFSGKKIFPAKIIFAGPPPPPPYYKPILPDCEANIVRKIDLA
jgi:hypothetical protein